jgi:hypothetical protein
MSDAMVPLVIFRKVDRPPQYRRRALVLGAIVACIVAIVAPANAAAGNVTSEHAAMQEWRVLPAVPVPPGGVVIERDTATWMLESGEIRYLAPLSDGRITGFVFEGRGRFRMEIPDPFEVSQLRRFTQREDPDGIDDTVDRLVVRTSGELPSGLPAPPDVGTSPEPDPLAEDRHEAWLEEERRDVDAEVLAAVLNGDVELLVVGVDTEQFGWLTYDFDPFRREEIALTKYQKLNDFTEVWVSLDRPEERTEEGRPSSSSRRVVDLVHVDLDIDLTDHRGSPVSRNRPIEPDWASFRATVELQALENGLRTVTLDLTSGARLDAVKTVDDRRLEFLRDHLGSRTMDIDKDVYDRQTVVVLPEPLAAGDTVSLVFSYDIETYNYASGNDWYPTPTSEVGHDLHTATMTFHLPKKFDVRAVGNEIDTTRDGRASVSVWEVSTPTTMVGYSFGRGFKEESLRIDGVPEVVAFGDPNSIFSGDMVHNVGADVVNSLAFYQWYFNIQIPTPRVYATGITAYHGQAFEGFLHLSFTTFDGEHPGASELFRAHEVAHQLWGHMVRWDSYRDQWLSESFAEYSAMMFIEATMPDDGYFEDILEVYTQEQLGSLKGGMSKFARPWDVGAIREEREFLGPVAAGYRASSSRIPSGYQIQAYRKGPLVLHMIRMLLQNMSSEVDVFRAIMVEFLHTYNGRVATTGDFRRLLEERTGRDWTPFFDAWVYGCEIPTYEWSSELVTDANGQRLLEIEVSQSGVSDAFEAIVPVDVDFGSEGTARYFMRVSRPYEVFSVPVDSAPREIVFNPDHAVLARVEES